MKKHKNKIIVGIFVFVLLAAAFFCGDNSYLKDENVDLKEQTAVQNKNVSADDKEIIEKNTDEREISKKNAKSEDEEALKSETEELNKSNEKTSTVLKKGGDLTEKKSNNNENSLSEPGKKEEENAEENKKEQRCTLSVRCDTILNNLSKFNKEKVDYVPKNGIIYAEKEVKFYEGESVFNLLSREMKQNKIHMEFENTPIYKSAYIEGIANIYEFDCGELSGWMYKVNGEFPNYGCSHYILKNGDKVEWIYTCDLGADVGGEYSAKNGR